MSDQFTSAPGAESLASGSQSGEAKASNEEVDILVVRLPRKSLWWKNRHTSGIMNVPAKIRDPKRLPTASVWSSYIEA